MKLLLERDYNTLQLPMMQIVIMGTFYQLLLFDFNEDKELVDLLNKYFPPVPVALGKSPAWEGYKISINAATIIEYDTPDFLYLFQWRDKLNIKVFQKVDLSFHVILYEPF